MRTLALAAILTLVLAGCSSPQRATVCVIGASRLPPNLALGPSRDHTILSEMHAYRSSWPSVQSGYLFDDVSTYTEVFYDDQSYYGWRDGGGFMREAVSVRSGVLYR